MSLFLYRNDCACIKGCARDERKRGVGSESKDPSSRQHKIRKISTPRRTRGTSVMMSEGDAYVDLEERVLRGPSTRILHTRVP